MDVICKVDYIIKGMGGKNYLVKRGVKGIANIRGNREIHVKLIKTERDKEINKESFIQRDFLDIKGFKTKWKLT